MDWIGKPRALACSRNEYDTRALLSMTYSKGVNHGLEAEIDLSRTDDLGNILDDISLWPHGQLPAGIIHLGRLAPARRP